ncbi:MCE family protein [bacterium]|nr:MCE family protein [bacterium]
MYNNLKYFTYLFLFSVLFSSTYEITIFLDDYSGLFQGSKVLSNQEKIGKIKLIEQNNDGKWLITLKIYEEYQNINSDMLFAIEGSSLFIDYAGMKLREEKAEEDRLAKIEAEEDRLAKIEAEEEAKTKAEEDRLAKIEAEEELLIKEKNEIESIRTNIRHFYFYLGSHSHEFKNPTFQNNLGNLLDIETSFSYGFTGNTHDRFPFDFKYDINYSNTSYNLLNEISFDINATDDLSFDPDGDGKVVFNEYNDVDFTLTNINSSVSFDLLPKFFIRPFLGVGYSYNTLELNVNTINSNDVELNFNRLQSFGNLFIVSNIIYEWKGLEKISSSGFSGNVYFDLSYRFSLIEKELKWDDIQFNIGFGI